MTLRRFLDVAYALLVEEYQRLGLPLLTALEKVEGLRARTVRESETPEDRSESATARQNEESLQQLNRMMAGG
jgi:hypothetical protein